MMDDVVTKQPSACLLLIAIYTRGLVFPPMVAVITSLLLSVLV